MSIMAGSIEKDDVREMLSAETVLARIPISRTTLFRLERDGLFPQGQYVTPQLKLWFKDEVVDWQKRLQDPESELSQTIRQRAVKLPKTPKKKSEGDER